ncbi:DUF3662 and FHA domain-containing protein [Dactylosporangium sp. AC04546]|uniref:FhaA domain-containing protein n=1 Tax=Dactylosporangium sp. AC04546 TaxID=2862460 RepID=UPI001EE0967E|nr:DUF3662 and FHA domain-containing protein [Dactylosporangium sp. AC04546]WVK89174.1 DUF3662 and FHA domain-containing protein [Dactylosporangium sp. AC04546]
MGVLQRFEKRLEGLVEGTFAKVFKGVVHPVELLNAMQREAAAHKQNVGGRILVPNRFVIELSPADHTRLAAYANALAQELAQSQAEFIGEQGWAVYGDVLVEVDRNETLDTGLFQIVASVHTGGETPARQASGVRLVTDDGGGYLLPVGSTVIGRGDQATVRLADVRASRQHARLDYDGRQVVLTDLGSANGSLVNGRRVATANLTPGDEIVIGNTRLIFRVDGAAEPTRVTRIPDGPAPRP